MGLIKLINNGREYIQEILKGKDIQTRNIDFSSLFKLILKENTIKIKVYPYYKLWGEVDTKKDFEYYSLS